MSRRAVRHDSIDLFDWPAVHAAHLAAQQAHDARLEALRRHRVAPHGQIGARLRALQEATEAALRAERVLAAALREARR